MGRESSDSEKEDSERESGDDIQADDYQQYIDSAEDEYDSSPDVDIDGTTGYRLSLHAAGSDLSKELHALARYSRKLGVTVVTTDVIQNVTPTITGKK